MNDDAVDQARRLFRYRENAIGRSLPCDPDWRRFVGDSMAAALSGARGSTDQQQCAYQGIRLSAFESGAVRGPWTKAFLAQLAPLPLPWYRRWWRRIAAWARSALRRINDRV